MRRESPQDGGGGGGEACDAGMLTMTRRGGMLLAYKWAAEAGRLIQSVLALLTSLLLSSLTWTLSTRFGTALASQITATWDSVSAAMTIEVISTTTDTMEPPIPILRLNSEVMDDCLTSATVGKLGDSDFVSTSNYNSSDGEQDSGLVFTDPEENEVSGESRFRLPQENYPARRDSDSSDVSSSDGLDEKGVSDEVTEKLLTQVESMFSDDHLAKDGFLLKHVRRRTDGFVSLKLVAGLRKVKQISRDFPLVLSALRKSTKLEVNAEGTKVRRLEPLTPLLKSLPTAGNKEKENSSPNSPKSTNGASSDSAQDDIMNR
jgi:hypothetical protein